MMGLGHIRLSRVASRPGRGPELPPEDIMLRRVVVLGGLVSGVIWASLIALNGGNLTEFVAFFFSLCVFAAFHYVFAWLALDWPKAARVLLIAFCITMLFGFTYFTLDMLKSAWWLLVVPGAYTASVMAVTALQLLGGLKEPGTADDTQDGVPTA